MNNNKSKTELINLVIYNSLIGKEIIITNSKIKSHIGIKGTIIFETNNFLELLFLNGDIKRFKKSIISFQLLLEGKPLNIDGDLLLNTLTQRIKKLK